MAAAMAITAAAPVYAKNGAVTSDAVTDREQKNSDTSEKLATQGMVLLQNKDYQILLYYHHRSCRRLLHDIFSIQYLLTYFQLHLMAHHKYLQIL